MSESITTKEFKLTHQLSDSAFQRLVKKICDQSASETDAPLNRDDLLKREGSHDWIIVRIDLFEAAIADRKPRLESSAIVPVAPSLPAVLGSVLDSYQLPELEILPTFKHVSTDDFVAGELGKFESFLDQSANWDEALDEQLIQQAIARGSKRGVMLAQIEVAAANKIRQQVIQSSAKKQGLEEGGS